MKFFLNNLSPGWEATLVDALKQAKENDIFIVPNEMILREALYHASRLKIPKTVSIMTRCEDTASNEIQKTIGEDASEIAQYSDGFAAGIAECISDSVKGTMMDDAQLERCTSGCKNASWCDGYKAGYGAMHKKYKQQGAT